MAKSVIFKVVLLVVVMFVSEVAQVNGGAFTNVPIITSDDGLSSTFFGYN